jgi:hypothetical protein
MPISLDAPPEDPEPKTERLPLAPSDAPAMTFPYRSMVATPSVPSGAPLRKAPDSFASMSTSFSAAPAAAAVACSLARPSGACRRDQNVREIGAATDRLCGLVRRRGSTCENGLRIGEDRRQHVSTPW